MPFKSHLMFRVVLAANEQVLDPPGVPIGVRIVNGYLQHWELKSPIPIDRSRSDVKVDLRDPNKWKRFKSDGNPNGPAKAGFDCICSVIIEFGQKGQLCLSITPLVLLDEADDYQEFAPSPLSGA